MKFILRRLVVYLLAAWGALTLNFALPRAMPGDPAATIFGSFRGKLKPEQMQAMKRAFGLTDAPLWQQYLGYLSHAIRGDFGISLSQFPVHVSTVISGGLMWTVLLGTVSLLISFLLGNLLGVLGAWKRSGLVDSLMPPLLFLVGSFPYFFMALLALYIFGFKLSLFPMSHAYGDNVAPAFDLAFIGSVISHLILPAGTIILVSIGGWLLTMRNTMIGVLAEDYLTMAEAKSLSQGRIMFNYAARNALLPNVSGFALQLGLIVGGTFLVEIVFSYPGVGFQLFQAVGAKDYPLLQGIFLVITLSVLVANLLADLVYLLLDPRTRREG